MNTELLIGGSILAVLIFALIIYVGAKDSNLPQKSETKPELDLSKLKIDDPEKTLTEQALLSLLKELRTSNRHQKSITTNVRFFVWLTIISLIVWLIALAAS